MNQVQSPQPVTFSLVTRLVVFTIGIAFTLLEVGLLFILLASTAMTGTQEGLAQIYPLLNVLSMTIIVGILFIPGFFICIQELFHLKPILRLPNISNRMVLPNLLLLGWLFLMGGVYLLLQNFDAAQWLLPLLQVPAILIPIFWLYRISTRNLHNEKGQRSWTLLGLNLGLQPIIVILIELGLLLVIGVGAGIYLSTQPQLLEELTHQFEQLTLSNFDPQLLETMAGEYVTRPLVVFVTLFYIAGLVPLIEELIKPFLVWRWLKKPLSPSQGFLIGLIGGSAFALWENLSALNNIAAGSWFFVVIARYGTSILHMATAALMGWALMCSFNNRKILRSVAVYFSVVLIHGAWNFFTLIQALAVYNTEPRQFPLNLAPLAPYMMVGIVLFCLAVLLVGSSLIYNIDTRKTVFMAELLDQQNPNQTPAEYELPFPQQQK